MSEFMVILFLLLELAFYLICGLLFGHYLIKGIIKLSNYIIKKLRGKK